MPIFLVGETRSMVIVSKVKLATIVEGNPKAPFSIATTTMCRGGRYSFPGLLYFTLDPYLIMLSAKQGGIKYHFLSLWYDSTWDWTQVSRAIGEHSRPMSGRPKIYLFISIITRITIHFHFVHHTFLFTFAFQWALNLIPIITFSNHLIFLFV